MITTFILTWFFVTHKKTQIDNCERSQIYKGIYILVFQTIILILPLK
jgi:hypothetical protein